MHPQTSPLKAGQSLPLKHGLTRCRRRARARREPHIEHTGMADEGAGYAKHLGAAQRSRARRPRRHLRRKNRVRECGLLRLCGYDRYAPGRCA